MCIKYYNDLRIVTQLLTTVACVGGVCGEYA